MKCGELNRSGSIAIVGGGPGGATLARLLQGRGFQVKVFERDASATARPQGGSLDLRADSGQRAVDAAGLTAEFAAVSREDAKAFRMLDPAGNEIPSGGSETHENPGPEIDRADLRRLLLDALAPDTVEWGHAVQGVTPVKNGRWRIDFEDRSSCTADLVVGADGMGSKVRRRLTSVEPIYTGITMLAAKIRKERWRGSTLSDVLTAVEPCSFSAAPMT
jgi:2-polyprenyl-6-methoxyphenol hydroxylase-like FAD-dependent oxidoreductase